VSTYSHCLCCKGKRGGGRVTFMCLTPEALAPCMTDLTDRFYFSLLLSCAFVFLFSFFAG
jgi:hypothetical protein